MRVFDAETMLLTTDLNAYFYRPMVFNKIPAYGANEYHYDQYLVHNGGVYAGGVAADRTSNIPVFSTFSDRLEGDYDMFPFVFNDAGMTTYFYDNKNKRFMSCSIQGRELMVASGATTNGQYNINSINRTMVGSDVTLGNNYLGLMTEGNNAFIYAFRLSSTSALAGGYYTELSVTQELDQITGFAAASDIERGYYTSKRKVFKVSAATGAVTEIYHFTNDAEIVDIKMLKAGDDANRQLVIALNKGGVGEVHCIYIDEFGDWDSSKNTKVYTGFGLITNLSYREAS